MFNMPIWKRNNSLFTVYFNDLTKLVKIMISIKFKESYSKDCAHVSKAAIKTYIRKTKFQE